ncbi:hypothetical protein RvY_15881 [Ramazzottius varieornatus]|uniref:PABS domain-containing protein n=1 Tax=Ramazzottius varieornatus TaxID=947166 RepID=A0A1D1VXX0_RAMVA|nr:hypothetical protein RvY_15881 [Ramazzottius varieornatus]
MAFKTRERLGSFGYRTRRGSLDAISESNNFHESNGRKWCSTGTSELLPGQSVGLEIDHIIETRKTPFNDVLLVKSKTFKETLILNGIPHLTKTDGFVPFEMATHVPLLCHPDPRHILIVGGMDGSGLTAEILKHPSVESIHHCEEDSEMVELVKKTFRVSGFDHDNPKYKYFSMNAKDFLRNKDGQYDVIITDRSLTTHEADPGIFGVSYFELIKDALKRNGIAVTLSWGIWIELRPPDKILKENIRWIRNLFPSVNYYAVSAPSFPTGQGGYIIASKEENKDFKTPLRNLSESEMKPWKLRYYNPEVHFAAFALPQFAKQQLFPPKPQIVDETRRLDLPRQLCLSTSC